MTVRSFQITAIGASHTRRELSDGTPVAPRAPGEKRDPKAKAPFKRYGYGDVIRLDDAAARSQSHAHLKLSLVIGSKPTKEDAGPVVISADWEKSPTNTKRALAASISGKPFKGINLTDAEQIIRQHLATLPVTDAGSGNDDAAGDA